MNSRWALIGSIAVCLVLPGKSFGFTNFALHTSGGSDGVQVLGPAAALNLSPTHSFMAWIQFTNVTARSVVFCKYADNTNNVMYQFEQFSSRMRIEYGDAQRNDSSVITWQTGLWYHVAFTHNGTLGTWYINGAVDTVTTNQVLHRNGTNVLWMGQTGQTTLPLLGRIDEVSIWTNVLSASSITNYMHKRLAGTETGLVAYWNFDGSNAVDVTAGNSDGQFTGSAFAEQEPSTANIATAVEVYFGSAYPTTLHVLQSTTNEISGPWTNTGSQAFGIGIEQGLFDSTRGADAKFYRISNQ